MSMSPTQSVDLFAPGFIRDPYPTYARLRQTEPVCPVASGGFLLTRYDDVRVALADPDFRNSPSRFSVLHPTKKGIHTVAAVAANILPFQDGEVHEKARKQINNAFGRRYEMVRPEIAALATKAMADAATQDAGDLIADFATPFSRAVMTRFLGISPEVANGLSAATDAFFRLFAPFPDTETLQNTNASLHRIREVLMGSLKDDQHSEGDDGFANALELSAPEIADTMILLYADGIENVQFAIGTIAAVVRSQPSLLSDIGDSDTALGRLIDEALRLHAPAQTIARIANQPTIVRGIEITAEMPVYLSIGSANRDEMAFDSPDTLSLDRDRDRDRDKQRPIPFGAGQHGCIGAQLARRMMIEAIRALNAAGLRAATPIDEVTFQDRPGHRWPTAVPFERST